MTAAGGEEPSQASPTDVPGQVFGAADLRACLDTCIEDEDLKRIILETCGSQNIGIREIGDCTVSLVSKNCYLTNSEAEKLIQACREAIAREDASGQSKQVAPWSAPADSEEVPLPELTLTEEPVLSARAQKKPSYLSPTAASLRHSKQVQALDADIKAKSPNPKNAQAKKSGNFLSRLLAPTASYLSRLARNKAESKEARKAQEATAALRQSQMLSQVLNNSPGQRVTKADPFRFSVDSRPKQQVLSTEEKILLDAQVNQFKRHAVPAHLHESRPVEGFQAKSTPKDPATIFKPFALASLDKHAKYQELRDQRLAEEERRAAEARRFKAQQLDKEVLSSPVSTPSKTSTTNTRSPTQGHAPVFRSAARAEHHSKVLEPARRARMTEAERMALEERERKASEVQAQERAEAERRAADLARERERESLDVNELRKSLVFKARPLPDFSAPFRPDYSKAAPVTQSVDLTLATTRRLGDVLPVRAREDKAAPTLSASACFSPDSFSGLRASPTTNNNNSPRNRPLSARGNMSMRASICLGSSPARPSSAVSPATAATLRASTSRLSVASPGARPASAAAAAAAGRLSPPVSSASAKAVTSPREEIKQALDMALELAASPRAMSRRATSEAMVHSPRSTIASPTPQVSAL